MGFFSKKNCDICGEKIGLIGNKKLDDGNMCKKCAKKLSPWFSDRRSSSISDIKEQLAYREDNKKKISAFNITRRLGESPRVLLDDAKGKFMVSYDDNYIDENPDVLSISDVVDCILDIDERKTEIMRQDKDGKEISYMIRRYDYSYDFNMIIKVRNAYFDEISFSLNSYRVDGNSRSEYENYNQIGEEICMALSREDSNTYGNDTKTSTKGPGFCSYCGAATKGDGGSYCSSCGKALK